MASSRRNHPPDGDYPLDEWRLVEKRFDERYLEATESLFATANGYLGMRGTCDEGQPMVRSGTYVNGFHETWPIVLRGGSVWVCSGGADDCRRAGRQSHQALRRR